MKTAVSIPDPLFRQADELARRLGKSRSQVYSEALREYVERRDARRVTEVLNVLVEELGSDVDPWVAEIGRRALERTEW